MTLRAGTMTTVQVHHLLNNGAEINQRDEKGFTPLHRAAYLAHYDGYMEIYEYLLVNFPPATGSIGRITYFLIAKFLQLKAEGCMCPCQSRGADPSIRTENYDPYLSPGKKLPIEVALDDFEVRSKLRALEKTYAKVS